jgi:hypothetical protein
MMRIAGREVPLEGRPVRQGDIEVSLLDPTLPRRYLGELTGLEAGLQQTYPSFR